MISISQLWILAKQGYASNFRPLLGLALIPYALVLLTVLVMFIQNVGLGILDEGLVRTLYQVISSLLIAATYVVLFVFSNLSALAMMIMIKESTVTMTMRQALTKAGPFLWRYIWVDILVTLLLFLWGLLFIIPAIIMAVNYSMAIWILLEGQYSGYGTIKQSKILVRGYWWAIFGRQLILIILAIIIFAILAGISWSIFGPASVRGNEQGSGNEIFSALINIVTALIMPFYMIYLYNIYKNLVAIKNQALASPVSH